MCNLVHKPNRTKIICPSPLTPFIFFQIKVTWPRSEGAWLRHSTDKQKDLKINPLSHRATCSDCSIGVVEQVSGEDICSSILDKLQLSDWSFIHEQVLLYLVWTGIPELLLCFSDGITFFCNCLYVTVEVLARKSKPLTSNLSSLGPKTIISVLSVFSYRRFTQCTTLFWFI